MPVAGLNVCKDSSRSHAPTFCSFILARCRVAYPGDVPKASARKRHRRQLQPCAWEQKIERLMHMLQDRSRLTGSEAEIARAGLAALKDDLADEVKRVEQQERRGEPRLHASKCSSGMHRQHRHQTSKRSGRHSNSEQSHGNVTCGLSQRSRDSSSDGSLDRSRCGRSQIVRKL